MLFTAKFMSLLSVAAASTYAASTASGSAPITNPEISLVSPSVILYDDDGYLGSEYSPEIPMTQCFTLPKRWQSRAESAKISSRNTCLFFRYPSCAGTGYGVSGNIPSLPEPLYDHVDSMLCTVSPT